MDDLEKNTIHNEENPNPPVFHTPYETQDTSYHGAGSGRKESPYADSPYVLQHPVNTGTAPARKQKTRAPREKGTFRSRFLAAILTIALVAGSCGITAVLVTQRMEEMNREAINALNRQISDLQQQINDLAVPEIGSSPVSTLPAGAMTPGQLYNKNVNSVVAISSTIQGTNFYGTSEGISAGSGFILTQDGYVVTNHHVIDGATSVSVITHDGSEYPAEIVGSDATNDVAVLKVEATGMPAATIGNSDALAIGDMVVAIGNPLGELTATQTVGYVSGKDRDVTTDNTIINMIQTDAAINPGNSGGPLFNMNGEVIGITTAKYSGSTIEGIGFAIPINDVTGIIDDLMDFGYVTGAYLGITVRNMDSEVSAMYGLPLGAYVESVEAGGSAHRAGVQAKDIIVALGDTKVDGLTALTRALRKFEAGDTTTITVLRGGAEKVLEITLDEKPRDLNTAEAAPQQPSSMPEEGSYNEWYDYFRRFFG